MKRSIVGRFLCGFIALIGAMAIPISSASAASVTGLTGKCGMLSVMPHPFASGYLPGTTSPVTLNEDILAVIDFDANTITFNMINGTWPTSGGGYGGPTVSSQQATDSFALVANNPTGISAVYEIAITDPTSGNTIDLNILPVNGGNTYLVQGQNVFFHGVCQTL